jgi:polyhydroxybutyrate depolymerase
VYVPSSHDLNKPLPIVIVLHGGGGTGQGMEELLTLGKWNSLADKNGFAVVYPDGIQKRWNDGREDIHSYAHNQNIDDVGFISSIIDQLSNEISIDQQRIYVTGISNGGMMSYRLACQLSHKIAAIAAVTASMSETFSYKPSVPVSILIINGTDDPLVPYHGGTIQFMRRTHGKVLSTADTFSFWKKHNKCSSNRLRVDRFNKIDGDGTQVKREIYENCKKNTAVILYTIEGGGHTWPKGFQYLPEGFIGKTSQEIDATSTIWDFFKNHQKH